VLEAGDLLHLKIDRVLVDLDELLRIGEVSAEPVGPCRRLVRLGGEFGDARRQTVAVGVRLLERPACVPSLTATFWYSSTKH